MFPSTFTRLVECGPDAEAIFLLKENLIFLACLIPTGSMTGWAKPRLDFEIQSDRGALVAYQNPKGVRACRWLEQRNAKSPHISYNRFLPLVETGVFAAEFFPRHWVGSRHPAVSITGLNLEL